jgi:DNA-binding transcriptional LysR family regulator
MRYQSLDLNLLVALRTLLSERSVGRSADKLAVSQPAMSAMLGKLREHFGDALILNVGRTRRLSPLGESLLPPVNELLARIDSTLGMRPAFDPATSRRRFRILASDYAMVVLLSDVLCEVHQLAPGITVEVRSPTAAAPRELENGEVDLLLVPERLALADHPLLPLFSDGYQVLYDPAQLPLGRPLTLERYIELRHVAVRSGASLSSFDIWFDRAYPGQRHIELLVPSFQLLPQAVAGTTRAATVHARMAARVISATPLRVCQPAFETPTASMVLQWHAQREPDAGCAWMRERIAERAQGLRTLPPPQARKSSTRRL